MRYTRFEATVKNKTYYANFGGLITDEAVLLLANNGVTPNPKAPIAERRTLAAKAAHIKKALLAGEVVETRTAIIRPVE